MARQPSARFELLALLLVLPPLGHVSHHEDRAEMAVGVDQGRRGDFVLAAADRLGKAPRGPVSGPRTPGQEAALAEAGAEALTAFAVEESNDSLAVDDQDRIGEVVQPGVQGLPGPQRIAVQAGIVESQGGLVAEGVQKLRVLGRVGALRTGRTDHQHSGKPALWGDQGREQRGPQGLQSAAFGPWEVLQHRIHRQAS